MERPGLRIEIDRGIARQMLEFWRERYDAIVVDGGDLRSAVESGFAELADDILLVTSQDLAALCMPRGGRIELLDLASGTHGKVRLVVNRYAAAGMKREDLRAALQLEPYATVATGWKHSRRRCSGAIRRRRAQVPAERPRARPATSRRPSGGEEGLFLADLLPLRK